jgi:hypothetical protein
MRIIFFLVALGLFTSSFHTIKKDLRSIHNYDPAYVQVSSVKYKDENFTVIAMKRDSNRVKAKYFAAADFNGNNVFRRYSQWVQGKNQILVSSGTYMDYDGVPVGLTIDNGVMVNKTVANHFDGLVIVNNNGGISVSSLKLADLKFKMQGADSTKKYDVRKSAWDLQTFIKWATEHEATVFQTHLLVYNNKLEVDFMNSSHAVAPRRFLAICRMEPDITYHIVIQCTEYSSIYDGSKKALDYLNQEMKMRVASMINLDTGDQDVFRLFEKDGTYNRQIKGERELSAAVNLLAYYFQ